MNDHASQSPASEYIYPSPIPTPDTLPFWQATTEGRFLVRRCAACGQVHWYPRPRCPFCGGRTDWVESNGRGRVYSFTTVSRGQSPFTLAYVTLAEGPSMLTHLVGKPAGLWAIGDSVKVRFASTDGPHRLPVFEADNVTAQEKSHD